MSATETRRLYVGGLFDGVTPEELRQRLSPFGNVHDVDIKVRKDDDGVAIKTFAYVNMDLTDKSYKQCLQTYNKSRWKGSELYLQVAKESFLDRLKREREETQRKEEEKEKLREIAEEKSKAVKLPPSLPAGQAAVPGTPLDGVKDWVVGKYGRVLPVVHIRRKDKKKVITVDPSKFCHGIKKLTAEEAATDLNSLTWTMEEKPNPHQQAAKHKQDESSDSDSSSEGSKKKVKKVKLDKPQVRSKLGNVNDLSLNGSQAHQNTNGGYKSDSESDSSDDDSSKYTKLQNKMRSHMSSLPSDSQDFEVVSISAVKAGNQGDESADSADTDEIISVSKSKASKKDNFMSSQAVTHNTRKTLKQKNGDKSIDKDSTSQDKPPKGKHLSKGVAKRKSKSSSSSSDSSDSDMPSDKEIKSNKKVATSMTREVAGTPGSEDSDSDSASELYQKSLELLQKAQEKMKKRKGEAKALQLDTFKAVEDMLQKSAELQPRTKSRKLSNKSSSDSDSESKMDITVNKKEKTSRPVATDNNKENHAVAVDSNTKGHAGSHSSSSDSDESVGQSWHDAVSRESRTVSTHVVDNQGADSSDSDTPMDIINKTKKQMKNTPLVKYTAPEPEHKLSNSAGVGKQTKNERENKLATKKSKNSIADATNLSSDSIDKNRMPNLGKVLPHEYHSSSSDSEDETKSNIKSDNLMVKEKMTRPFLDSKLSSAKLQPAMMATFSEYSSGLEAGAGNGSSSEEEEEDLLDMVASGKQAALKNMASALERSPAAKKEAAPSNKSTKQSTSSAKESSNSDLQKSSQKPQIPSSEKEPEDNSKKKAKKAKVAKVLEEALPAGQSEKKPKEKNPTKQAKHELSNQKRLESLKERKKEISSQQSIIKNALANVDSAKSKHKITFDSDDEDDAIASSATESAAKDKESQGLRLFDSDASSGEEDQDDAENEFRMRPEKEGKAGAKLQRLQNRYGNDDRFKLTANFLDSDGSGSGSEKEEMAVDETDEAKPEVSDRERSLRILQSVVGNQVVVTKKQQNRDTFRNVGSLHYDPSKEDHQQFEIVPEQKTKKKKVAADKNQTLEAEGEPMPEVSKETFFNVRTDLKAAFQKDVPSSGGFSFTSLFGGEVAETSQASGPAGGAQPLEAKASVSPWEERFGYDSSDEDEGQPMDTQEHAREPEKPVQEERRNTFFFTADDPRIKEGLTQFCRQEDMETIRARWEERRPDLVESFRMQRKRALRNAHNTHNARNTPGKFQRSTPSKRGRQR